MYCPTQKTNTYDNKEVTVSNPNCLLSMANGELGTTQYCMHIPTDGEGMNPVFIGAIKTVWPSIEQNIKNKQNIMSALQPLFPIIAEFYSTGVALTSIPTSIGNSTDNYVQLSKKCTPYVFLQILKKVLPLINPCIDVNDLPNSLKNHLNKCPNDDSVYVCSNYKDSDNLWNKKCPSTCFEKQENFFNTKTIILTFIICVLLAVCLGVLVKNYKK
jgi:hypothetical protein